MEEDYQVHQCMLTIHLRKQNLVIFSNLVSTSTLLYLSSFSWHLSPASHFVSMVIDQSQMPSQQPQTLPNGKFRLGFVHVVWKFPELPFSVQTYLQSGLDPHASFSGQLNCTIPGAWTGAGVGSAVGDGVGDAIGDRVGNGVGNNVGDFVGDIVGDFVGLLIGEWVGLSVGAIVGSFVGDFVGSFVGDFVGSFVGNFVGSFVGNSVGSFVGDFVGSFVGSIVGIGVGA